MYPLGQYSPEEFLAEYWQQKPLHIPNAYAADFIEQLIDGDTLAGLSLEEEVESRLVFGHWPSNDWQCEQGPFTDETFQQLPKKDWCLLVQAVDHYLAEVGALKQDFNFVPFWQFDDIMVSYSTAGGGVGPHFDNYDVFLLQGSGERQWQLSPPKADWTFVEDSPLKIIEHWEPEQTVQVQPGDLLYVPAKWGHFGVSKASSITLSIGYRTPNDQELCSLLADFTAQSSARFFSDAAPAVQAPGLLSDDSMKQLKQLIISQIEQPGFEVLLARYLSLSKYDDAADLDHKQAITDPQPHSVVQKMLNDSTKILLAPEVRCFYLAAQNTLFVDGYAIKINTDQQPLAQQLADAGQIDSANAKGASQLDFIAQLFTINAIELND